MSYETENLNYKGYTIRVVQDEDPESPDGWDDDEVFLVGFSGRNFEVTRDGLKCPEDIEDWRDEYDIFQLDAYIHSGVSLHLSGSGPSCGWDRGQIGFALVKKRSELEQLGQVQTWPDRPSQRKLAEGLVETWNQYLSGDVWGYIVEDSDGEEIEALWGCYGSDYCLEEAKELVDCLVKNGANNVYGVAILLANGTYVVADIQAPAHVGRGGVAAWATEEGPLKNRKDIVQVVLYTAIIKPLETA